MQCVCSNPDISTFLKYFLLFYREIVIKVPCLNSVTVSKSVKLKYLNIFHFLWNSRRHARTCYKNCEFVLLNSTDFVISIYSDNCAFHPS